MIKKGKKIWVRLFVNIASIFVFFVLCISLAGKGLFIDYFTHHQEKQMRRCAKEIVQMDLSDREKAAEHLRSTESQYNVSFAIYKNGNPIYLSVNYNVSGIRPDMDGFDMIINRSDHGDGQSGVMFDSSHKMMVYYYAPQNEELSVEVFTPMSLIENSADVAGDFCIWIASICLAVALVWSVIFSRRFVRPIVQMNEIAVQMSELDFSRKIDAEGDDEIALLGNSLNRLSESLSSALNQLNERNSQLQSEIEAERRLDTMRKGFVANVSHELKTPIAIIQGYAEGLNEGMAEDADLRKKYCDVILDESRRMNALVISLLELSKYEGGIKLLSEPFDLAKALAELLERNRLAAEEKELTLELRTPQSIAALGDRVMFEQVVQNYLSNAVSHSVKGGNILVYTEPYLQDGLRVCVYNSGSHISPENMELVWQSFWRADKAHSRSEGRFGLGLSVVKAIMCAANLDFGVFNTDDGVVFWAQIPLAQDQEQKTE